MEIGEALLDISFMTMTNPIPAALARFDEKFCQKDINGKIMQGSSDYFCCSNEFCTGHESEIEDLKAFLTSELTLLKEQVERECLEFAKNVRTLDRTEPYEYGEEDNYGKKPEIGARWTTPSEMADAFIRRLEGRKE